MSHRKIITDDRNMSSSSFLFKRRFKNKGKQGIVGKGKIDNHDVVFKISQYMNYLA